MNALHGERHHAEPRAAVEQIHVQSRRQKGLDRMRIDRPVQEEEIAPPLPHDGPGLWRLPHGESLQGRGNFYRCGLPAGLDEVRHQCMPRLYVTVQPCGFQKTTAALKRAAAKPREYVAEITTHLTYAGPPVKESACSKVIAKLVSACRPHILKEELPSDSPQDGVFF